MRIAALMLLLSGVVQGQVPATVRGTVQDSQNGERLARVRIALTGTGPQTGAAYETVTDPEGHFEIAGIAPGDYLFQGVSVGYRLVKKSLRIAEGDTKELEVALTPDSLGHTETVEVRGDPFEPGRFDSPSELTLAGSETKNLASVLADDPLRAVASLPGVTSNDDFDSRFSLRAAAYGRIGLYLDDILLHQPFHLVQNDNGATAGTLTIFNGDMVEQMALYSGAFPVRYGDRTAAALDVRTREGSRERVSLRGTASASNAGFMAEGPLGAARRGSWLAAARKSYLQYIIKRTSSDPTLAGGFSDVQFRIAYDPARNHNFSLGLIQGSSGLDRTDSIDRLGLNSAMTSDYQFTLATAGWRFTSSPRILATQRVAFLRERYRGENKETLPLTHGRFGEWAWTGSVTWMWAEGKSLDAGWTVRRTREDGFTNSYQFNPLAFRRLEQFGGRGVQTGGYVQQSATLGAGRIHLTAGARWERFDFTGTATVSPHASVAVMPAASTKVLLGWGEYAQFPEYVSLSSSFGSRSLAPERAIHFNAAVEQRLGARSRMRIEAYQRLDRDLLFRSLFEPRLLPNATIFNPPPNAPERNSLRGYARGAEIFLQSRTANRLTGWISYALGYSNLRDGVTGARFPADQDQRHTVNLYGSYRVRPTVNLSVKYSYGSGFPVPGFFRFQGGRYFLAPVRNAMRLSAYHRADVRINKAYLLNRCKLTLYAEIVNLFNHENLRYDTFGGYNSRTGQASPRFNKMFPILPSAGIAVEF